MRHIKRTASLFLSALAALLACASCSTRKIVAEEALQLPTHARIYTASNIWYENPAHISSQNFLKGNILPFGTEVEFIEVTEDSIEFRTVDDGRVFNIDYDKKWTLEPVEERLPKMFCSKSADDTAKDMKPSIFEKLKRGVVEDGMTKDDVLLAYGYPLPTRTSSIKDDTWIYWKGELDSKRVVFRGEKVTAIIDLD